MTQAHNVIATALAPDSSRWFHYLITESLWRRRRRPWSCLHQSTQIHAQI